MKPDPDLLLLNGDSSGTTREQTTGRHDPNRFVEIGSVTKTFTAALLQQLEATGVVRADDLVSQHLDVAQEAGITLGHLADHTSGLQRLPPNLPRFGRDPYAQFDGAALTGCVHDLGRLTDGAPGERVEYSNLGYAVLGAALAGAAGTTWFEAIDHHVLGRLSLPDPVTLEVGVPTDRRLDAVDRRGRPRATWTWAAMAPAGGLWTTPRTLAVYTRMVLVDRVLGDVPRAWQSTGGLIWHNGGTRDATTFVGARDGATSWAVCHGLGRPPGDVDLLGVRSLAPESVD